MSTDKQTVVFSSYDYQRAHGKRPTSRTSGRWAFSVKGRNPKTGTLVDATYYEGGTLAQAKAALKAKLPETGTYYADLLG